MAFRSLEEFEEEELLTPDPPKAPEAVPQVKPKKPPTTWTAKVVYFDRYRKVWQKPSTSRFRLPVSRLRFIAPVKSTKVNTWGDLICTGWARSRSS